MLLTYVSNFDICILISVFKIWRDFPLFTYLKRIRDRQAALTLFTMYTMQSCQFHANVHRLTLNLATDRHTTAASCISEMDGTRFLN